MERQDTLLIASASPESRSRLRQVLQARYNLLEASDVWQALALMGQNMECVAALVLDVDTIDESGRETLQQNQYRNMLVRVPVIVVCSSREDTRHAFYFRYGAADVIPLDYDSYAMLHRIETIAELHKHKFHLEAVVQEQADILRQSSSNMVDVLSTIIEYRSLETGNHVLRIRGLTRILMEEVMNHCPEYGISPRQVSIISGASVLHDIGKISIPDAILNKSGPLNREEWESMKDHTLTGCRILDSLGQSVEEEYLRFAHNICHYHHERWDGSGYPEGLAGDAIPICAQVVGLADAYDALTNKRVYKDAYTYANAMNMILNGECGAFSPKLLECFKHVTGEFEALGRQYADGDTPIGAAFDMTLPAPSPLQTNSLERTRAKYYALVHYIDAFLVEVELDQELFHIVYNPYPELSQLGSVRSLEQLRQFLLDRVVPEQRERMHKLIYRDIPEFVDEDLRRSTHRFQSRGSEEWPGGSFELTLLRVGAESGRRSLAVLCRRLREGGSREVLAPPAPQTGCMLRNDRHLTLVSMGKTALGMGSFSPDVLNRQMDGCLMNLIHPDDRARVREAFRAQLRRGPAVEVEHRLLAGEDVLWVVNRSRMLCADDGQEYLHCILTDISRVKREQEQILSRLQRYEIILAQSENVLFEWDMERNVIEFADTWQEIFGYSAPVGDPVNLVRSGAHIHPDDTNLLLNQIRSLSSGSDYELAEVRIANSRGRYLWCRVRATALRDRSGTLVKVVGIILNINQEKQTQQLLEDRSARDSLTKLLNNAACRDQAEAYLDRYPGGVHCALMLIDLDNFKQINDQYGHLFGDAVLCKVARELERLFRSQDIIGRIGGDEFLVLMRGVSDRELLRKRCNEILEAFRSAFPQPRLSGSVGVACSPDHGTTYQTLFARADEALYHAKDMGRDGYSFYGSFESQHQDTAISQRIDSDVELGLAQDNLVRHVFQSLYAATDVEGAVNSAMDLLGRAANVSRVYVFENSRDGRFCDNTFEWCNVGIQPEIHNLQKVSYETDIPGYEKNFDEDGIFHCPDISMLPQTAREILEAQGIRSMLQCAITQDGKFMGYIGFDECVCQRQWTQEEIQLLNYFSRVLSTFLLKHREQERANRQARELQSILENQNSWLYIIDPETCQLQYVNAQLRCSLPFARLGEPCYHTLFGREERCPNCPARNIRATGAARTFLRDDHSPGRLLTEATLIQWQEKDACLMTCRALPEL